MSHGIVKCKKCDKIIRQCKCMSSDKKVYLDTCKECGGNDGIGLIMPNPDYHTEEREFQKEKDFAKKLREVINSFQMEHATSTPDYLLTDYLMRCYNAYKQVKIDTDKWNSGGVINE